MAAEHRILKQDGYLNIGSGSNCGNGSGTTESRNITYHPNLNVILVFDSQNQVKILDVHSGVILQNYNLNTNGSDVCVCGKYMPLQEKVLFWDGRNLGFRGDYNSVLLLDTILQPPILQNDDLIKLELLLSEAVIFQTILKELEQEGLECPNDVSNELLEKIRNAQANAKKGIKAQRWNTICLEVSYSSLKLVANNVVVMLKRLERHIPALAIASGINERLTDLLAGSRILDISWHGGNFQRVLMYSEAVRRQTFEKWPHMDYKWALPDQMAQAGFYHQPSSSGEDRAMCFTCSVCLVCWEKTDEPWSEHERHSPTCPFVKGEYTQNVPLSVTYATNPAVAAPAPGFDVISNSDYANVLCTSYSETGEITIWSIERYLKQMHTFNIATLMKDICDDCYESVRVTAICVLPNSRAQNKIRASLGSAQMVSSSGGGNVGSATSAQCTSTSTLRAGVVGSKIVLGLSIRQNSGQHEMRLVVLNIIENDRSLECLGSSSGSGGDGGSNKQTNADNISNVGGSGDGGCDNQCDKFDQRDDDNKSSSSFFEKYADSFDSNGFMSDLVSIKNNGSVTGSGDKSDAAAAAAALNDLLLEGELIKIDPVCDLSDLSQFLDKSQDGSSVVGSYFKDKLIAASQAASNALQQNNNNNNNNGTTTITKTVSEEIDCVVESYTSVDRMNAMASSRSEREIIEIAEIVPTDENCNQLLVKLVKSRVVNDLSSQIIMSTVEDLEDESMEEEGNSELNIESACAQILLYDCNGFVISDDYNAAVSFSLSKYPRQLCLLPSYNLIDRRTHSNERSSFDSGALCVVCADGSLELYSLDDLHTITTVNVENEHFVSVVYCKSLDRLCGCTRNGSLIFYSLNDTDNESGDELIELDDECNTTLVQQVTKGSSSCDQQQMSEVTEIDGSIANTSSTQADHNLTTSSSSVTMTTIKVDVGNGPQSSPSPSSSSTVTAANLLAYKTGDLTMDDLLTFYALTQFDEMLTPYTAEVPSCWNELVQAQKQRKQPQHLRPGDDTHLTKTWRLHNDATTWDEHIIELNLAKAVTLGHIDMKFTLYQQCSNPAAIQVTLLKQNTSGFGYRMKGPHSVNMAFKQSSIDENIDFSLNNSDGSNENPVLTEEYLQTHNAEILAGPIELSSCMDLCDQGGTITLTSPKLFKTRTRNFLLHIKTMSDPSKEGQGKTRVPVRKRGVMRLLISSFANSSSHNFINNNTTSSSTSSFPQNSTSKQSRNDFYIGCDWLHEISITVRGVKTNNRIPNERLQRIAMLESNVILDNLFKIVSSDSTATLSKNLALDILNWICTIRLNRFRSPKTERFKQQHQQKATNATSADKNATASLLTTTTDLVTQQAECIAITEKYLQDTILNCIVRSDRSMAHKCVKLILILTDGVCNLPIDIQTKSTLDLTIKNAVANTLMELPKAKYSSVVRWFTMLACSTSTPDSHNGISEICIKLLSDIVKEIDNRWDPYCSLLGTRFGLYGFPFEPEIFDFDLPNLNKSSMTTSNTLAYIIRSHAGLLQTAGMDFKKLSSIDGVEFRSFPHLIKCKGVSNQLRGLLEVEQLHFTCAATSEATRIDNMDSVSSSSASNINMEELIVPPIQSNSVDVQKEQENDKMNDIVNNVKNILVDKQMKIGNSKQMENEVTNELTPNGFGLGPSFSSSTPMLPCSDEKLDAKFKYNNHKVLPKFKAICQYIENCDEIGSNGSNNTTDGNQSDAESKLTSKVQRYLNEQQQQRQDDSENMTAASGNVFPWHKILAPPPKQMVVIDRMHSGARRFVVLDFGSPILLTDLVIPACDELASLHIDIWCFEEEADSVRLVVAQDIGTKTLVLSDIQPPPICRYMKITIIGRYGMSSTKCKIPIGSFYGHTVVLENDGYGDPLLRYMKHPQNNIPAQIIALNSLYEDVHCRYSLSSCKLMEMLAPILNCDLSNIAHMQAFINKQREEENNVVDSSKIVTTYEECIMLQHQINVIRNVIYRLESSYPQNKVSSSNKVLKLASRDKLRVLSQNLVEILLHFSIEYGIKNILPLHAHFNIDVANMLFNTLVVYGDAHIQLATCSLLVRMCCFQNWWGDFLADIFCNLFSSQNSKIFPQDRIFFLLTYLGRRSIAMGTCRSIVIDAVLKTLAKLLAPISPRYQEANQNLSNMCRNETSGLWSKSDLQLITWLLLFLSVCLDDNAERKDKSSNRWEFMSCETDFTKTRSQSNSSSGKQLRCFKKRIIQQNKYSVQPYTDWGKKIFMIQNEHPGIFMELTGKPKPNKSGKSNTHPKAAKETVQEPENNFDKGLKAIRFNNILIVIRGLIALLLEMDFTCNMDLFLLTCKVIARLVSACRPSVQLSKIVTISQLEQLIRLAVWNDQQQPWAVHAITCLLQDLLDADKHYKDNETTPCTDGVRPMEGVQEAKDIFADYPSLYMPQNLGSLSGTNNDIQYNDGVKYSYLPSLIECEDTEFDEILNDIDIMDRSKNITKKDSLTQNKNNFNFFCKSISSAMDARLDFGIDTNVEIHMRRLTMISSLDMYASLPQILTNEFISTPAEATVWPEYITDIWSGPEYNCGPNTYQMFKNVFDCIFADLHLQDTWVHLEQVLQMWMTLNSELSEKPYNTGLSQTDIPKIPFGANAVQGLLLALAWHNDIKLRTWCLGFQCLFLACNSQANTDDVDENDKLGRINDIIINDENFEKMLLRFFSGYGMSSTIITNRCAGPTICKHLHELLFWLHKKGVSNVTTTTKKRKLTDTLLNVILQLVQPGGAISNQQGPIDAQSQLVRDLLFIPYDKADLNVSLSIIESVSFLVYNNIANGDKIQCQRSSDANNSTNTFSSLFANVLGSENSKQNTSISDNSLIISLLKLSSSLIQTELPRIPSESIPEEREIIAESQTDEIKAEQLNIEGNKMKTPYIADTVLRHFPTMKRLLGSLSHCTSISFTLMASYTLYTVKPTDSSFLLDEPQTTADAVFYLLISLCEKASHQRLIVAPICQYLETSTLQRNSLPRLQLSEPFLYYIFKVLEVPTAVQIFTQLGGIQIICQNLVKLNKILINMQPGLISLIMQHMTKNTKLKLHSHTATNGNGKKSSSSSTQAQRNQQDGLINFAPFCSISSENDTAQSADILIVNPVASHRRPRTPAWSYMFYPNESHVDLTITLPTAILLREIQLQPHSPTLASCPSAVALEVSRDYGLGPIPFGPPLTTTGMTCIRLKLSKPEIATSVVLRLYRPKDSSNIGLTQIAILGNTIFSANTNILGGLGGSSSCSGSGLSSFDQFLDDDSFAKTSIGWVRILARCYNMASIMSDAKLTADVIGASAEYPGFLEACCSLMNIMPMIPNAALQNLESVLLKLGAYNKELCLSLIRVLLWGTTPQTYKLSNESICDLLFELATSRNEYITDKIQVLLEWIVKLRQNFSNRTARCTNPQSGFVKCVASILWSIHSKNQITNLHELITNEIFDACMYWIDALENEEPLKVAFDSLLCSLCCIKPELFNQLLYRLNVRLTQSTDFDVNCGESASSNGCSQQYDEKCGITDDNKGISGSEWFRKVAADNLSTILQRPVYLSTLAMSCQSPLAIYQLVDSGLLKLLAYALFDYCCSLLPEIERVSIGNGNENANDSLGHLPSTSALDLNSTLTNSARCLTDADKAENYEGRHHSMPPLLTVEHIPKILDFFSECCAEGHVRDWLGTQQGSIFWRPLLELLCNYRPIELGDEQMQQSFIRMERATINFFTRITACHPRNQDHLTLLLISVIKSPSGNNSGKGVTSGNKAIISGFTRQIVLQLLLENERILVSVRSKQPLQRKEASATFVGTGTSIAMVNHHPSKRINAHHLLFYVSANTKCQEILQNCISENRQNDGAASSTSNISSSTNSELKPDNNEKSSSDPYGGISLNFNGLEHGMEFLSVAAGVTAKDKRIKDVKNQVAAIKDSKDIFPNFSKLFSIEDFLTPSNSSSITNCAQLVHPDCPDVLLTSDTTISQVLATLHNKGQSLSTPCITLNLMPVKNHNDDYDDSIIKAVNMEPLPSPLQRFSSRGGLSLLAQYLPTVYPDGAGRKSPNSMPEKEKSPPMTDWVKLEPNDEIYEDLEDPITEPTSKHTAITSVPQHSLAAFGLFLRLPTYSDVLLRDKLRAQCLLRLVLGVTGDGEGNDIYSLSLAPSLPTLPFEVFRQLLDSSPLTTDDGMLLRRMVIEVGAMHLVLNCLSIFTHQSQNYQISSPQNEVATGGIKPAGGNNVDDSSLATSDDKSHMYWAKGTGFGTGSTAQSWNVEQALLRQKSEEEHVTVLLQVLSSYVNPGDKIPSSMQSDEILTYHEISDVVGELPLQFLSLLQQSCLIPALSSYLRNDSVLDITRHIPLYRGILQLLRALSLSYQLVGLLQPQNINSTSPSISELLDNMKTCVDTYAKRLKLNKKSNIKGQTQQVTVNIDDGDDEGLALLIPDIQETAILVQKATKADTLANQSRCNADGLNCLNIDRPPLSKSIEQRYLEVMKKLQFDTSEMIVESENNGFRFVISHHFEKMVRMAGDRYHPSRVKRLAQEAVTLSTSLPLSYSSSVFVRCDTDRLDIMKVLITGPADTPYANGCFEFDVFFPPDYPNLPMLINLETTGRHSVRFNPNLYNDGKVCLSVLNTWHGRPEEKWNAQTSSFLQVLVSIQSLILVPEPYFNEPGFERSRGTPSGTHSSREYNSNIYQACVRWAMLEQIRNPSACFKDVIHTHFWMKRNEICAQIENWIEELSKPQFSERNSRTISFNSMVLRRQYRHLREELGKLKIPEGLEDLDMPFNPNVTLPVITDSTTSSINTITTTASSSTCNMENNSSSNGTATANTSSSISTQIQIPIKLSESATYEITINTNELSQTTTSEACASDEVLLNLSSPASPPSSSSCSESAPIPMIVEVSNEFTDLSGSTTFLPTQPPVPPPVTATVTTVQAAAPKEIEIDENAEEEDVVKVGVNDLNYTEDEVQMLQALFFNDEAYENSKLNNFNFE